MTYNKPEIAKLDCATKAIQGNLGKPSSLWPDFTQGKQMAATPQAYEADE